MDRLKEEWMSDWCMSDSQWIDKGHGGMKSDKRRIAGWIMMDQMMTNDKLI